MKKAVLIVASLLFTLGMYAQVSYLQYRVVPDDREDEFVEKETKYWSKVAEAAIDQGNLVSWTLWRKVGVTDEGAPNYVFVNSYESLDKMDPSKIWSEENLKKMGAEQEKVETNSFTKVPFDAYMQLEAVIPGDYKFAIVNYAKPASLSAFIEENKTLWKPLHEKNIKNKTNGMTSWGLMSTIYPGGHKAKFSCFTWDGFNTMADAMKYMSYKSPKPDGSDNTSLQEALSKSKMDEFLPDGFIYRIIYERVKTVSAAKK